MQKTLNKYTLTGIIISAVVGTLLHFVFAWSSEAPIVGAFSAVNESTWEHLKLLFFPCFVLFWIEYRLNHQDFPGLLVHRIQGLFLGLAFIPVAFYTYVGIIGRSYMVIDISLFFIGVLITWIVSSRRYQKYSEVRSAASTFWTIALFVMLGLFILFTYCTPHIGLFMDPTDCHFGI